MVLRVTFLVVMVSAVAAPSAARAANTWCSTNHPGVLFCEDFDRWCASPPPAPQVCTDPDPGFPDYWGYTTMECGGYELVTENPISSPYAMKVLCGYKGDVAHVGASIRSFCQAKFGGEFNGVVATDLYPIQLDFVLHGSDFGKVGYANSFLELSWGTTATPQTPTNGVTKSSCCGSSDPPTYTSPFYTICQQDNAPSACPPIATAPHTNGIAVGAVANLDTDPCHCGGRVGPVNYHLSFYNGYKWNALKQGLFSPGGGSGGGGDFLMNNGPNTVRLTITGSKVKVELTANTSEYSWCEVPLDYRGPFNVMFLGYPPPCPLWDGTWTCSQAIDCLRGVPGGGRTQYDNIVLAGGQGYHGKEACCFANATCEDLYYMDCQARNGTPEGVGSTCANYVCCPAIVPDHDVDGDVDLQDFGWFQTCLNGDRNGLINPQCKCADLNTDGDVDVLDFTRFLGCMSGSEIPASPTCGN